MTEFNPTTFKPRNSLVLVKLFHNPEEQVGQLILPTADREFTEAEIIAVGQEPALAAGAESTTHDLKPGQRVYVRHQKIVQKPSPVGQIPQKVFMPNGLELHHRSGKDKFFVFEQADIIAIVQDVID